MVSTSDRVMQFDVSRPRFYHVGKRVGQGSFHGSTRIDGLKYGKAGIG